MAALLCPLQAAAQVQDNIQPGTSTTVTSSTRPTARIAVVLPFRSALSEGRKSLEFYRGMLLAADALRAQGYDATLAAYHEGAPNENIDATLDAALAQTDLVVGCWYRDHIISATRKAAETGRTAAFPLATYIPQAVAQSPSALFTLATPARTAERTATLVASQAAKANVILLTTADNAGNASSARGTSAASVKGGSAAFAKPLSATAAEAREVAALLKKKGCKLKTASTMTEVASALNSRRPNLIITDAETPEAIEAFNAEVRTLVQAVGPSVDISVVGLTSWPEAVVQQAVDHGTRGYGLYLPLTAYVRQQTPDVQRLRNAYREWFHCEPMEGITSPLYAGYDFGLAAITGLANYGSSFTDHATAAPLVAHAYNFERYDAAGCLTDGGLRLLHCRADGGIDLIMTAAKR